MTIISVLAASSPGSPSEIQDGASDHNVIYALACSKFWHSIGAFYISTKSQATWTAFGIFAVQ